MKKFNFILNTYLIASILCSSVSIQGMKRSMQSMEVDSNLPLEEQLILGCCFVCFSVIARPFFEKIVEKSVVLGVSLGENISSKISSFFLNTKKNEQYNNNHCLLINMLPPEPLSVIFSHCLIENKNQVKSLENSIKTFMKLSCVCKIFHRLLNPEKIGDLCKNYAQENKDIALKNLLDYVVNNWHNTKRLPALILVCSGADANTPIVIDRPDYARSLLEKAVCQSDTQAVAILLKHHANPYYDGSNSSKSLHAKSIEIVQLFIDHGVNLNLDTEETWPIYNVLNNEYEADLVPFYIKHGANPSKQIYWHGCMLHWLVCVLNREDIKNHDNFLKKAEYLINAIPNEINTINGNGETPLDKAQRFLSFFWHPNKYFLTKKLIDLFRKHGALTAKELNEKSRCIL